MLTKRVKLFLIINCNTVNIPYAQCFGDRTDSDFIFFLNFGIDFMSSTPLIWKSSHPNIPNSKTLGALHLKKKLADLVGCSICFMKQGNHLYVLHDQISIYFSNLHIKWKLLVKPSFSKNDVMLKLSEASTNVKLHFGQHKLSGEC